MKFLNKTTRKFTKKNHSYTYGHDGNLSSVFIKDGRWKASVDHFSSTPLFYSDNYISPSFKEIVDAEKELGTELTIDKLTTGQLKYLRRHTVGPGTIYNQIKRVEENWLPFLSQDLIDYDMHEEYERFCYLLDLHKDKEMTVGLSGGRDSAWLTMFLKHRGYNPNLVHITSPNNYNGIDDACCFRYKKEMGWNIENFEVEFISDVFEEEDEVFKEFWPDLIYPLKSHSVKKYEGIKISGECSESSKANKIQWMLDMDITDDDVFITNYLKHNFNNRVYYGRAVENYDPNIWKTKDDSLEYIFEYYRNIIKELGDHPLRHSSFWIPSYQASRLYQESQDPRNEWFSPFADFKIQTTNIFKKKEKKVNKEVFDNKKQQKPKMYEMGKKYFGKEWSEISWEYDIVGMGIPYDKEQLEKRKVYTNKRKVGLKTTNRGLNPLGVFILKDYRTAQYFANKLWIQNAKFDIISEDGTYPKVKKIRDKLWKSIKESSDLMVIPIGCTNLELLKSLKTKNIITLFDSLLKMNIKSNIGGLPNPLLSSMRVINEDMTDTFQMNITPQNFMTLAELVGLNLKDPKYLESSLQTNTKNDVGDYDIWNYKRKENIVTPNWKSIFIFSLDPEYKFFAKEITFEEILEGWKQLWPDREKIPKVSTWILMEDCFIYNTNFSADVIDHDINIRNTLDVNFYGVYDNQRLIGVNSGHRTSQDSWRSRGLWVHPKYRGRKISKILLNAVVDSSATRYIWSCPKVSAINAYKSVGFKQRSDSFDAENGKNIIVTLDKENILC